MRSCSLGEVIEDALRESLASLPKQDGTTQGKPIKTYGDTGLLPAVDLSYSASLLETMDGR